MKKSNIYNLGVAITELGLEDKFLSSNELENFSLLERGKIVDGIIYEKLQLGRWQEVVNIIYDSSNKIRALFSGDRKKLQKEVIKSAVKNPKTYIDEKTFRLLCEEDNDLLFKVAIALPLNYKIFMEAIGLIDNLYFDDIKEGDIRKRTFHKIAGKKALKEGQYRSVLGHFKEINYQKGLAELFEVAIAKGGWNSNSVLEEIALSEQESREGRLKRIILESKLESLEKFGLCQKHNISLKQKEEKKLYEEIAKAAKRWNLQRELSDADPELKLLWAKKHAESEPKTAYKILKIYKRKGEEKAKLNAIISGLQIGTWPEEKKERRLELSEIEEEDLKKAYEKAPFSVKVEIAQHLRGEKGFDKELKKLSREAYGKGNLKEAYELWCISGEDFDNAYVDNIRKKLIKDSIDKSMGYVGFIHKSDKTGKAQAFDALMEQGDSGMTRIAYELAIEKGVDIKRLEKAREALILISPTLALKNFRGYEDEIKDPNGVEYVLNVISNKHNVDKGMLEKLVGKYLKTKI